MEDIFAEKKERGLSVSVVSLTKSALHATAESFIQQVEDGEKDPIEVLIQAKALQHLAKDLEEGVRSYAMSEAYMYDKADRKMSGVQFNIKNLPNKYKFDHSAEWLELTRRIDELVAYRKELEDLMIAAIKTGEMIVQEGRKIYPAVVDKHGGETIEVKIPK